MDEPVRDRAERPRGINRPAPIERPGNSAPTSNRPPIAIEPTADGGSGSGGSGVVDSSPGEIRHNPFPDGRGRGVKPGPFREGEPWDREDRRPPEAENRPITGGQGSGGGQHGGDGHGGQGHGGHGHGGHRHDGDHYGDYGGYGHTHNHYYGCGHRGWGGYWGFGLWGHRLGFSRGWSYSPYYYGYWGMPYFYGSTGYSRNRVVREVVYEDPQAPIDLNIKPKDTEVYLNGRFIGTTGDFDGYPGYLWLNEDYHELIFFKPGYATEIREIETRRGEKINMRFRMTPGVATPPEDLTRYAPSSYSAPAPGYSAPAPSHSAPTPSHSGPTPSFSTSAPPAPTLQENVGAGRVRMQISPAAASVYIDGRFVGIAGEISAVEEGLMLAPGEHTIQVFHPGYASNDQVFTVDAGRQFDLVIDLFRDNG